MGSYHNDFYWTSPPNCIQQADFSNLVVGQLYWNGNYDNNTASYTWDVFADDGNSGTHSSTDIIYPNSCNQLVLEPGMIKDNNTKLIKSSFYSRFIFLLIMLKIAFDKIFKHPLDKNHRFPMVKYELLPEQLLSEGTCSTNNFFSPTDIDEKVILETHSSEYYQRLTNFQLDKKELRAIGFPMSDVLIEREKNCSGYFGVFFICFKKWSFNEYCRRDTSCIFR